MLIDWFTVVAQAANFLILVWLLKRFLYKPILHAIDAREKLIADELADADTQKAAAHQEHDSFRKKNEEFEEQRASLLEHAKDDAEATRLRLVDEANKSANLVREKRNETLRNDAHNLNKEITRRAQHEVFAIARKTLRDLAEVSLDERIAAVFVQRLADLSKSEQDKISEAIRAADGQALVRSAFELSSAMQATIQSSLDELCATKVQLKFEADPELVGGIELAASGQKLAWSITEYLSALEKGVSELIPANSKPIAAQAPGL